MGEVSYKGSYRTIGKKTWEAPTSEGADLSALPNDAFFGTSFVERVQACFSRLGTAVCLGCRRRLSWNGRFCPACLLEYKRAKNYECGACGRRLSDCDCSSAYLYRNRVPRAAKLLNYQAGNSEAVENRIIRYLKTKDEKALFRFFAAEMQGSIMRLIPPKGETVLSFVPRSQKRTAEFGFDQAKRLAEALGECLSLPVISTLRRKRGSTMQKEQETMKERLENARRAFVFCEKADVRGKTVLLVDDILTTGATMVAAASVLRKNGAKHVYAVVLATAIKHPNIVFEHAENTHIPWYENRR
jgi:ComF family protein